MLMTLILVMSCMSLNFTLLTMAPQYASYGRQKYVDVVTGDESRCSRDAPVDAKCRLTVIATLMDTISLNMTFFSIAFYYLTWIFLGCAVIGCIVAIWQRTRSNAVDHSSDSNEDEF